MNQSTLILITSRYPYRSVTEATFIGGELQALSKRFDRIIIMPIILEEGTQSPLPPLPGVEVDTAIADSLLWRCKILRPILSLNRYAMKALLTLNIPDYNYALSARVVGRELRRRLKEKGLSPESTLVYSYWFESQADGAVMSGYPTIIRAHGHDVWTDRGTSLRHSTLRRCVKLFAASEAAANHFREQFPDCADKIAVAPLGSRRDKDVTATYHTRQDSKLTFITCARTVKGKYPVLTYKFMKAIAIARPATQIKWIYVGDGPEMQSLKDEIAKGPTPDNLTIDMRGELTNSRIHDIYTSEPIDWNILLTESEGGRPISLCEALSYGVPVVSTEVGGVPELIDDDCGLLLAPLPESEEFVRGIAPYLDSDYRMGVLREGALQRWHDIADSCRLSREFADTISSLNKAEYDR